MFQILKNLFSSPFDEFCEKNKHLSHPQHFLLHPGHSPNSRVPCTDVLSFITRMLMEGQNESIKKLMRLLVVGNSLGTGDDWTSTAIDAISRWNLKSYIQFNNEVLKSGVMKISDDPEIILQSFNQGMLFQMCQERGYDVKKSCKRDKLLQILLDQDQAFKAAFIEKNKPQSLLLKRKLGLKNNWKLRQRERKQFSCCSLYKSPTKRSSGN